MAQKYVKLNSLVFYCTSQEPCKRSACIVHGEGLLLFHCQNDRAAAGPATPQANGDATAYVKPPPQRSPSTSSKRASAQWSTWRPTANASSSTANSLIQIGKQNLPTKASDAWRAGGATGRVVTLVKLNRAVPEGKVVYVPPHPTDPPPAAAAELSDIEEASVKTADNENIIDTNNAKKGTSWVADDFIVELWKAGLTYAAINNRLKRSFLANQSASTTESAYS